MNTLVVLRRSAALIVLATVAAIAFTSCATDLTHPPVYRGQYYAFDAYPYGYQGYPGFPYYGAPFGYGGPAFAVTERQRTETGGKEVRQTTTTTKRQTRR